MYYIYIYIKEKSPIRAQIYIKVEYNKYSSQAITKKKFPPIVKQERKLKQHEKNDLNS